MVGQEHTRKSNKLLGDYSTPPVMHRVSSLIFFMFRLFFFLSLFHPFPLGARGIMPHKQETVAHLISSLVLTGHGISSGWRVGAPVSLSPIS